MSRHDWFRNERWAPEIEIAFEAKLRRARNKTQYLRLQAGHLTKIHPEVALALIERYLVEGADISLASAYETRAHAFLSMGKVSEAVDAFEAALSREREFPNWRTRAAFDLLKLIVEREMTEKYTRAQRLLDGLRTELTFPADRYIWAGATALILYSQGRHSEARALANEALAAATVTQSGFRYHPDVGLVRMRYDTFGSRVNAVAGKQPGKNGKPKRNARWRLLK